MKDNSRFKKKALNLSQKIASYYNKEKPEQHPHSFTANKYRISVVLGILLIIYAFFKIDNQNNKVTNGSNTAPDCGIVGSISETIQNSHKSISALYDIYKDGGLKVANEVTQIDTKKRVKIDFSKTQNKSGKKNILICGERATAKIGKLNNVDKKISYQIIDFTVGDKVENNIISAAFLQLAEGDDVMIGFIDSEKAENTKLLYISDIKPETNHHLDYYSYITVEDGNSDIIMCRHKVSTTNIIYNINKDIKYNTTNTVFVIGSQDVPIIFDRIIVGNYFGSKLKVFTKIKNLCHFKNGIDYKKCSEFWQMQNTEENKDDVVELEISNIKPI